MAHGGVGYIPLGPSCNFPHQRSLSRTRPMHQQPPPLPPQKRARTTQYASPNPFMSQNQVSTQSSYLPPPQYLHLQPTNPNPYAKLIPQNPSQPLFIYSSQPRPPAPLNHGYAVQTLDSQAVYMSHTVSVGPNPQPLTAHNVQNTNSSSSSSSSSSSLAAVAPPQPLNQRYAAETHISSQPIMSNTAVSVVPQVPDTNSFSSLHAFISSLEALAAPPQQQEVPLPNQNVLNSTSSSQQPLPPSQSQSQSPDNAASALINYLIGAGLISLPTETPKEEEPLGLEFDPEKLKVRHESVISALYSDLPRQCTTCGCRFKTQEEHSKHMDWHVSKNRMAKPKGTNKMKTSRPWLLSSNMWLIAAEAVGKTEGPNFSQTEASEDVKDDYQVAVPADENQTVCELCLDPFEEFFSHETDVWMYKGTAYLNAPSNGSIEGIDRSRFGPIVHAKCK